MWFLQKIPFLWCSSSFSEGTLCLRGEQRSRHHHGAFLLATALQNAERLRWTPPAGTLSSKVLRFETSVWWHARARVSPSLKVARSELRCSVVVRFLLFLILLCVLVPDTLGWKAACYNWKNPVQRVLPQMRCVTPGKALNIFSS